MCLLITILKRQREKETLSNVYIVTFYIVIKFCFVPLDENQLPINHMPQSNYYL